MALRILCDRCDEIVEPDSDWQKVSIDEVTDEGQIEGSCEPLGDFCGKCVRSLRSWLADPSETLEGSP